jgi:hypothetical protein
MVRTRVSTVASAAIRTAIAIGTIHEIVSVCGQRLDLAPCADHQDRVAHLQGLVEELVDHLALAPHAEGMHAIGRSHGRVPYRRTDQTRLGMDENGGETNLLGKLLPMVLLNDNWIEFELLDQPGGVTRQLNQNRISGAEDILGTRGHLEGRGESSRTLQAEDPQPEIP